MTKKLPLPKIMIAPNGARRMKTDHPALPITIDETIETAAACYAAGAHAIHLHIREDDGTHSLNIARYVDALEQFKNKLPNMAVQITTEAVGQYSPADQRELVKTISPKAVSISIAEILSLGEREAAIEFYEWCDQAQISVQHILYNVKDAALWLDLFNTKKLQEANCQVLFVLGRHTKNQESVPADLDPFLSWMAELEVDLDWAVCAFGVGETACLKYAVENGGKIRLGFENSLWNSDGTLARDNAERVSKIVGSNWYER